MAEKTLHEGTEAAHSGGHAKVFPPLDPTTFAPQLVWLAIVFVALYVVMSRIALPRIGEVIEERRDRIQRDLDSAERLKGETERALAAYEKALANARGSASKIAKDASDKLGAEVEKERAQVDRQVAAKIADAEARIAATKTKAIASVNEIAAQTATSIVKHLSGVDVSADDVKKSLQSAAGA